MLTDSHTHLYLDEFEQGGRPAVERAIEAGVGRLMFPNVDLSTIEPMKKLAALFPEAVDMAMGLHPTEVNDSWKNDISMIVAEAKTGNYCAIGEIGIDLYWDKSFVQQQIEAFKFQCELANQLNLPIIIHCREGLSEILDVFSNLSKVPSGVFHSFGGTVDDVDKIREFGDFYFGINGIVTFKSSKLKDVLPHIGIDRILLETDSPYLAPVPMRGKRNESAYIVYIAEFVANALNLSRDEVFNITTGNYSRIFNKKLEI